MTQKKLPFTQQEIDAIIENHPTPFHIYDEKAIRENARALLKHFAWNEGFQEFFAVKAAPNPFLMKILGAEGFGTDCSSQAELVLSEKVGITGENIMFSSNDTPAEEFIKAAQLGAVINLDDLSHLDYLIEHTAVPQILSFRYNPGKLKEGNAIIGHPEEAKYGCTRDQMFEAYARARDAGVRRFGIHTMVASNELDPEYFIETGRLLFELVGEISEKTGVTFEFANLGGGIGIPYKPDEKPVDLARVSAGLKKAYDECISGRGLSLKLFLECGRMITGPYGYLVTRVRHLKKTYKDYVGTDASMANLMRPGMYGAYHHITVLGKEDAPGDHVYDVTGSLCENNDKFAIDRALPSIDVGDTLVIHDSGAHGHAMGFNYNGKLRSAELLLREDGSVMEIRRAETLDDYFATLDFNRCTNFSA